MSLQLSCEQSVGDVWIAKLDQKGVPQQGQASRWSSSSSTNPHRYASARRIACVSLWPWPLIFWPQNIVISSLCPTAPKL